MARNQVFNTGEKSLKFIVQSSELLKSKKNPKTTKKI